MINFIVLRFNKFLKRFIKTLNSAQIRFSYKLSSVVLYKPLFGIFHRFGNIRSVAQNDFLFRQFTETIRMFFLRHCIFQINIIALVIRIYPELADIIAVKNSWHRRSDIPDKTASTPFGSNAKHNAHDTIAVILSSVRKSSTASCGAFTRQPSRFFRCGKRIYCQNIRIPRLKIHQSFDLFVHSQERRDCRFYGQTHHTEAELIHRCHTIFSPVRLKIYCSISDKMVGFRGSIVGDDCFPSAMLFGIHAVL